MDHALKSFRRHRSDIDDILSNVTNSRVTIEFFAHDFVVPFSNSETRFFPVTCHTKNGPLATCKNNRFLLGYLATKISTHEAWCRETKYRVVNDHVTESACCFVFLFEMMCCVCA